MKLFITGSSGLIGSAVVKAAILRKHQVWGLVRSEKSAEYVQGLGATPVIGTLHDSDILRDLARKCDAVIHTARDTSIDPAASIRLEIDTIRLFGRELASSGANKVFVMASSFIGMDLPQGTSFDETCRISLPSDAAPSRSLAEATCMALEGVRPVAVRVPMQTHDDSALHYFITLLIQYAKARGYVPYFEDHGQIKPWTCTHVTDVALAFVLAAEKAQDEGIIVHPVAEMVPAREIVQLVGQKLGLPCKAVQVQEIQDSDWPRLISILGANVEPRSERTRRELDWKPDGEGYLTELKRADELFTEALK